MQVNQIEGANKVNLFPRLAQFAGRAKIHRLLCIHCNNLVYLKYTETCSVEKIISCDPQQWVCHNSHLKEP